MPSTPTTVPLPRISEHTFTDIAFGDGNAISHLTPTPPVAYCAHAFSRTFAFNAPILHTSPVFNSTFIPFKRTSVAVNVAKTVFTFASKTMSALMPSTTSREMVVLLLNEEVLVLMRVSDFVPFAVLLMVILSLNFKSFVRTLEMDLPISEKYVVILL